MQTFLYYSDLSMRQKGNGGADGAGAWFWWSKEGATTYVQLYRYLYDY